MSDYWTKFQPTEYFLWHWTLHLGAVKSLFIFFTLICGLAHADDWKLRIACDTTNTRLRVGDAEAPDWPIPSATMRVTEVAWPALGESPRQSSWGNSFRLPGKINFYSCGDLKVALRHEYLNENPDGELGLIEFISVEVFRGKRLLVSKTGFYQCSTRLDRFQYFGKCPEDYARTVEISTSNKKNGLSIVVHREFQDDSFQPQKIVDTAHDAVAIHQ